MSAAAGCDVVMLIGFGGPQGPTQIRPYLDRVLRGRPVPAERYEEVVRHYQALGGRSPYNELTLRQAAGVREALVRRGCPMPVAVGFRHAPPYIEGIIRELAASGHRRVLGFILAAFRCEASWERYQNDAAAACAALGASAPAMVYPAPWHTRPGFISAVADNTQRALAQFDEADRRYAELIFTAHSIPLAMAAGAPYVHQLEEAASLVARTVGRKRWQLAFQSRSGNPREPWLEPDVHTALCASPAPKLLIPLGFLCDHIEVLYDLDVEAAAEARAAGLKLTRAAAVNDHSDCVGLMADMALEYRQGEG